MATGFELRLGEQAAAEDLIDLLTLLEVEEHADLPGAVELTLPVNAAGAIGSEDLTVLGHEAVAPYSPISVVVTSDAGDDCIFDGYVLSHRLHLDRGTTRSSVRIWGQDASCLMNLEERVRQHEGSDGDIANQIFGDYGFRTASGNTEGDQPLHEASGHTLVQRATDAQFLRDRARRTGRLFRVACDEKPGDHVGYFVPPDLTASPGLTMTLNPPDAATVDFVEISWDVARPTRVAATALLTDAEPVDGAATESGLAPLDARSLAEFTGEDRRMTAMLTTTVDTAEELRSRSRSLLTESGSFVRCEGEADVASRLSRARDHLHATGARPELAHLAWVQARAASTVAS